MEHGIHPINAITSSRNERLVSQINTVRCTIEITEEYEV